MTETIVAALLATSMSKHRASAPTKTRRRNLQLVREAYDLRKQAHSLDPEHTDAAWADEQSRTPAGEDTHAALMQFYGALFGE